MNLKTKSVEDAWQRLHIDPYKYLGKTENYAGYLRTRSELGSRLMLHQPLVQKIFRECVDSLPEKLFNLAILRKQPNELKELDDAFNQMSNEAYNFINKFYYRIVEMVEKDDTKLDPTIYQKLLRVSISSFFLFIGLMLFVRVSTWNELSHTVRL